MRLIKKVTGGIAVVMVLSLTAGLISVPEAAAKKAKPMLNCTRKEIKEGESFVIKAKNISKVSWSVKDKKVVALKNIKKKSVKAAGRKTGTTQVIAKYKNSGKNKKMQCKVIVKTRGAADKTPDITAAPAVTDQPGTGLITQAPAVVPTAAATAAPTDTPEPTPVPTTIPTPSVVSETGSWAYIPCDDDSLLKEYEGIFGNVGTCLTYDVLGKQELQDPVTMKHVRDNYNSFTLENEMKPSYILADPSKNFRDPQFNPLISCDEAVGMGYIIPAGYNEDVVPTLNFETLDKIMQVCKDNGIRMRGHTLIWHSQTPVNFFREDYKKDGAFVSSDVMDQRVIYYVTNVMKHICDSPNSDVVYTWDVVNEYFHQHSDGTAENWSMIYDIGHGSTLSTKPTYVKLAFKTAYDVLKEYELTDKVPLFYNDYNTSQVANEIVDMVKYINEADEINPDGEKICAGVGMQCHLGIKWPTVSEQLGTVEKFLENGFEVQITELDIVNNDNNYTDAEYCEYWFQYMKGLVQFRMKGLPITGVTFWGLSDSVSWRFGQSALLYGKDINDPKKALYAVYAAAQTSWGLSQEYYE